MSFIVCKYMAGPFGQLFTNLLAFAAKLGKFRKSNKATSRKENTNFLFLFLFFLYTGIFIHGFTWHCLREAKWHTSRLHSYFCLLSRHTYRKDLTFGQQPWSPSHLWLRLFLCPSLLLSLPSLFLDELAVSDFFVCVYVSSGWLCVECGLTI